TLRLQTVLLAKADDDKLVRHGDAALGVAVVRRLSVDLTSLLDSGMHSDVTLIVQGEHVKAHGCVLSARSPVFRAMFTHAMLENKERVVRFDDVSLVDFRHVLRYMYSGRIDGFADEA